MDESFVILLPIVLVIGIILVWLIIKGIIAGVNNLLNYYPNIVLEMNITRKQKLSNNDFVDLYITINGTQQIDAHLKYIDA